MRGHTLRLLRERLIMKTYYVWQADNWQDQWRATPILAGESATEYVVKMWARQYDDHMRDFAIARYGKTLELMVKEQGKTPIKVKVTGLGIAPQYRAEIIEDDDG